MTVAGVILRLVTGVIIGFSIGLTGTGGGVLGLPALTLILRCPPSVAVGTASLYAFLTNIFATCHHIRLKTIERHTAGQVLLTAVPANVICSMIINRYIQGAEGSAALVHFQHGLRMFMAIVVCLAALVLMIRLAAKGKRPMDEHDPRSIAARLGRHPRGRVAVALLAGALIGGLIGATSVGGGVVTVPLMIIVFGLSSSATVGTSVLVATVLTMLTSVVYGRGGQVEWATALLMAVGSLLGVPLGSRMTVKIPERPMQWVLSGVILSAALLMLFKGGH
jgi:uncharacterized membrane protein YfcA